MGHVESLAWKGSLQLNLGKQVNGRKQMKVIIQLTCVVRSGTGSEFLLEYVNGKDGKDPSTVEFLARLSQWGSPTKLATLSWTARKSRVELLVRF